ncbi:MAG TPA: sigma-70 family RNA polymerase sigma factor [Chloroflexota bacterium]
MTFDLDPAAMSLPGLARACAEETSKYKRGETVRDSYCMELLRRAICDRDGAAWEVLLTQYRGLVLAWVRQHPASATLAEEGDYWVMRVFERFWMAVGPDRFGSFGQLAGVLRYLKMCVHSVLLDEARARAARPAETLDDLEADLPDRVDVEAEVLDRVSGPDLWAAIERVLIDESERRVIYCSFALEMKPSEIHAREPELFATVADVYRIKRNAIDRLRRSADIREYLGPARENGEPARSLEER